MKKTKKAKSIIKLIKIHIYQTAIKKKLLNSIKYPKKKTKQFANKKKNVDKVIIVLIKRKND